MNYIIIYFIIISIIAITATISDKIKAIKHKRRISEKTLFIISAFGGSAAMLLTMIAIRHKTKHKRFMIGIPLIIIVQLILIFLATKLF